MYTKVEMCSLCPKPLKTSYAWLADFLIMQQVFVITQQVFGVEFAFFQAEESTIWQRFSISIWWIFKAQNISLAQVSNKDVELLFELLLETAVIHTLV